MYNTDVSSANLVRELANCTTVNPYTRGYVCTPGRCSWALCTAWDDSL